MGDGIDSLALHMLFHQRALCNHFPTLHVIVLGLVRSTCASSQAVVTLTAVLGTCVCCCCSLGSTGNEEVQDDTSSDLLQRYLKFDDEMSAVSVVWRECQQFIERYNDEQVSDLTDCCRQ